MNFSKKQLALDFKGYSNYLVPGKNQIIPRNLLDPAEFRIEQTDYAYFNMTTAEMSPAIPPDSYVCGEIISLETISQLNEGVYAIAVVLPTEQRLSKVIFGRLKNAPAKSMTLWSDASGKARSIPVDQIAFLFRLFWYYRYESHLILPR